MSKVADAFRRRRCLLKPLKMSLLIEAPYCFLKDFQSHRFCSTLSSLFGNQRQNNVMLKIAAGPFTPCNCLRNNKKFLYLCFVLKEFQVLSRLFNLSFAVCLHCRFPQVSTFCFNWKCRHDN